MVLLTTAREGRPDVTAMSWHTMREFEQPRGGCVGSGRNYRFASLKVTRECAIGLPTADLAEQVGGSDNASGVTTDKLAALGLTPGKE